MKEKKLVNSFKFLPKAWASALFFVLLIFVFALFYGRKYEGLRLSMLSSIIPEYQNHISNFSISYLLYTGVGYMWLMAGVKFKYIGWYGLSIIAANLLYELWIPVLNVIDPIDAYFGVAGTIFGCMFLACVKKYGLVAAPKT